MKALGFVIVQDSSGHLFAGYKHPGTQKIGHPVWVSALENMNFDGGKASIYASETQASEVAVSILKRDLIPVTVKSIGVLGHAGILDELLGDSLINRFSDIDGALDELFETGSYTLKVKGLGDIVVYLQAAHA